MMLKNVARISTTSVFSRLLSSASKASPNTFPLSKIVATIGPASEQLEPLIKVTQAGLNIMRINFSHATYEEADLRTNNLRQCPGVGMALGKNNMRAVLLDTQGPEVRSGSFGGGVKEVQFVKGMKVILTTDKEFQKNQSAETLWVSYEKLPDTVKEGDSVLLDDGSLELKVVSKADGKITCEAQNSCLLGSKKGVNFPGLVVDLPMMCDKDREDLRWGIKNDIDFIAASFTRKASDVREMRAYCRVLMREIYGEEKAKNMPLPKIISKIENTEGLDNIDEIIEASDGIMVARGDLGVEIPMETLTRWQKKIVRKCNLAGKPVVVATQMLESMQKNPRPTRAECTDVANACFDGADCVMLSGESAKGKYPWGSVEMMQKLIKDAEKGFIEEPEYFPQLHSTKTNAQKKLAKSIAGLANSSGAKCIIVHGLSMVPLTSEIAKHRPNVPIVVILANAKYGRQLQVWRGVYPVIHPNILNTTEQEEGKEVKTPRLTTNDAVDYVTKLGFCAKNDKVVVVDATSEMKVLLQSARELPK